MAAASITSPSCTVRGPDRLVGYAPIGLAVNSTGRSARMNRPVRLRSGAAARREMPNDTDSCSACGMSARFSCTSLGSSTSSPAGVMPWPAAIVSACGDAPPLT